MEKDLSKPFVNIFREGEDIVLEMNSPNDQIGDFAFEWDIDGSQRKRWEEYLQNLERKGIRGELSFKRLVMKYNPAFDNSDAKSEYPLSSYKMIIYNHE